MAPRSRKLDHRSIPTSVQCNANHVVHEFHLTYTVKSKSIPSDYQAHSGSGLYIGIAPAGLQKTFLRRKHEHTEEQRSQISSMREAS